MNSGNTSTGGGAGAASANGCTYTQGYWKTHPTKWPVSSLVLGGVTYSAAQLEVIFQTAPMGDASLVLAHQLIAALLNEAAGAQPPAAIAQAISDAQTWMAANLPAGGHLGYGTPAGSAAGMQATALTNQLDGFNSGMAGLPHCGDSGNGGNNGSTSGGGDDGGASAGGTTGGGGGSGGCPNGCSDGGVDPCNGIGCPSGYACFQGVCQPPVM